LFQRYGASCLTIGYGRCELPDCYYVNLSGIPGIDPIAIDKKPDLGEEPIRDDQDKMRKQ
ncbi:MAG TPA: hypothetical protein VFC43_08215, partial [Methanoregula sp.]|nr:hypothetical protein [Methanoregula sp.]